MSKRCKQSRKKTQSTSTIDKASLYDWASLYLLLVVSIVDDNSYYVAGSSCSWF